MMKSLWIYFKIKYVISMAIYGIGTDLIEIERIKDSIEKLGRKFLNRIYTENEINYCTSLERPFPSYAARFAAKEAFSKALGTGIGESIRWNEIEVIHDKNKKPSIIINTDGFDHFVIHLSLSHSNSHATAYVVIETKTG